MPRSHVVTNATTGETLIVPFTPEEEAAAAAAEAAANTPANFPLSMRQLRLGLLGAGFPVDFIASTISGMSDPAAKAAATIWYEETSTVHWDHAMTQALISEAGLTEEQASLMWMAAKDLDA